MLPQYAGLFLAEGEWTKVICKHERFAALALPLARTFLVCVLISGRINHDSLDEHECQFRMTAALELKQVGNASVTIRVDTAHTKIKIVPCHTRQTQIFTFVEI